MNDQALVLSTCWDRDHLTDRYWVGRWGPSADSLELGPPVSVSCSLLMLARVRCSRRSEVGSANAGPKKWEEEARSGVGVLHLHCLWGARRSVLHHRVEVARRQDDAYSADNTHLSTPVCFLKHAATISPVGTGCTAQIA